MTLVVVAPKMVELVLLGCVKRWHLLAIATHKGWAWLLLVVHLVALSKRYSYMHRGMHSLAVVWQC